MNYKFACIIPFYQKKRGILTKAVNSILEQNTKESLIIVIIDDASPISAKNELQDILELHSSKIKVIEQKNQGAAIARNSGLDYAIDKSEYIAFLDSDDLWSKDHLTNAEESFHLGADLYFSDIKTLEVSTSRFKNNKFPIKLHKKKTAFLFEHQGSLLTDILQYNIMATPTVVYRVAIAKTHRFQTHHRFAGEDHLFWMGLSQRAEKTIFSSKIEAFCGEGINIFSSASWGEDNAITRIYRDLMFRKSIPDQFELSQQQKVILSAHISRLRMEFAQNILHKIKNRKPLELKVWKDLFLLDPLLFFLLPINIALYLKTIIANK